MCGINGCIDKKGQRDLVKTRGNEPTNPSRGLTMPECGQRIIWNGMQRLSIIDLKTGYQPMHNPTTTPPLFSTAKYIIIKVSTRHGSFGTAV